MNINLPIESSTWESRIVLRYDVVYSQFTEWNNKPCSFYTIEWGDVPRKRTRQEENGSKYMLYSATNMALTNTSEAYLSILECQLYPEGSPLNYGLVNSIQSAKRTSVKHCDNINFYQRILHHEIGSLQQARLLTSQKVVTSGKQFIYVWDLKNTLVHSENERPAAQIKLALDDSSSSIIGPALCVAKNKQIVVNGSGNGYLALWNLADYQTGSNQRALMPRNKNKIIEDPTNKILSCDCKEDSTNISCTSSRGNVIIWDYRTNKIAQNVEKAHKTAAMSCHMNPHKEHYLLTSSADGIIEWWDTRKMKNVFKNSEPSSLSTFKQHQSSVNKVSWSPHNNELFASCSDDCSVIIWNTEGINKNNNDKQEGAKFKHTGHRQKVLDIAWHPDPEFSKTIASVSPFVSHSSDHGVSGLLQVWRPNINIDLMKKKL
ncbi:WD40-repeat-containing domain protein [Rhizophagus diaphanus]|nr:WD40-repeat-containing domain protein [Rhizophagus diaphanus] [Rhizophagus sp. MUCL 43196]